VVRTVYRHIYLLAIGEGLRVAENGHVLIGPGRSGDVDVEELQISRGTLVKIQDHALGTVDAGHIVPARVRDAVGRMNMEGERYSSQTHQVPSVKLPIKLPEKFVNWKWSMWVEVLLALVGRPTS
jgi:hypothetical protein